MSSQNYASMALSDLAMLAILRIDDAIDRPECDDTDLSVMAALAERLDQDLATAKEETSIPHRLALYLNVLPDNHDDDAGWTLEGFKAKLAGVKDRLEKLSKIDSKHFGENTEELEEAYSFCVQLRDAVVVEEMKALDQLAPLSRDLAHA